MKGVTLSSFILVRTIQEGRGRGVRVGEALDNEGVWKRSGFRCIAARVGRWYVKSRSVMRVKNR